VAGRAATPGSRRLVFDRFGAGDRLCLGLLLLLTVFAGGRLVIGGTIVGQDSATQFYPWYSYLGERLRSFQIPEWTPAQFGGSPFAADPQSGWTYLPAMLLFSILPLTLAVNAYLLSHLALAGFSTYALARVLGIGPLGALGAAVAYELSGLVYGRSVCCPAQYQVAAWMPLLLLGAEIALWRIGWSSRVRWWGVSGLALSQILASWLGQVSYYALLVLGVYLAYRTLIDPPQEAARKARYRIQAFALNSGAILTVGFGLAAAGIIPRLEYNGLSNVAGGVYRGEQSYAAVVGGWVVDATGLRDLGQSLYYPGGAVLALGLMAIVLARGRYATPYFLIIGCAAMILASDNRTPLHAVLYLVLPHFEVLHSHWPERIAIVVYLAPAMLAGATVDALPSWLRHRRRLSAAAILPSLVIVIAAIRWRPNQPVPWEALSAALLVIALVVAVTWVGRSRLSRLAPAGLLIVVTADLLVAGPRIMAAAPYGGFHRLDLGDYYEASGAVHFLQERQKEEPVRYFGYDPAIQATADGREVLYRDQFAQQDAEALIVNNRATVFGLQDLQGYNPVQLQRFVDYMTALNGQSQEYHDANVLASGLDSPLLDLMNVRYIVIPATIPPGRDDLAGLITTYPVVYRDADVQIVERTSALPRAWIVHAARQAEPQESLTLLATGMVDPRETALLESAPPELERPSDPSADRVTMLEYQPESITLRVSTSAAGLLVLSDINYPGWQVFIDGKPADAYGADYLFRAVAVTPGEHIVEWRYQTRATILGLAVSVTTFVGLVALAAVPVWTRRPTASEGRRRALSPLTP
jgi:hypothetical protein